MGSWRNERDGIWRRQFAQKLLWMWQLQQRYGQRSVRLYTNLYSTYVCVLRRLQLKYVSLRLSAPVQKMLTDKANTARSQVRVLAMAIARAKMLSCMVYQLGKLVGGPYLLFEHLNAPNEELELSLA